jgi:hypothetical protein
MAVAGGPIKVFNSSRIANQAIVAKWNTPNTVRQNKRNARPIYIIIL